MALSRARTYANSWPACIRISVSALTLNAFSNRTAISADKPARPPSRLLIARRVTHSLAGWR